MCFFFVFFLQRKCTRACLQGQRCVRRRHRIARALRRTSLAAQVARRQTMLTITTTSTSTSSSWHSTNCSTAPSAACVAQRRSLARWSTTKSTTTMKTTMWLAQRSMARRWCARATRARRAATDRRARWHRRRQRDHRCLSGHYDKHKRNNNNNNTLYKFDNDDENSEKNEFPHISSCDESAAIDSTSLVSPRAADTANQKIIIKSSIIVRNINFWSSLHCQNQLGAWSWAAKTVSVCIFVCSFINKKIVKFNKDFLTLFLSSYLLKFSIDTQSTARTIARINRFLERRIMLRA